MMTNNNKTNFTTISPDQQTNHYYYWIRLCSIVATLSCVAVFAVLYSGTSSSRSRSPTNTNNNYYNNIIPINEQPGVVAATTTTVGGVATTATKNSIPIFGSYPGWTQGGNLANIEVEIFIDYLCSDSKNAYPIVKDALETLVDEDYTLLDGIQLRISNFPLDFHVHSWQVGQLLPYFLDRCQEREYPGNPCSILNEYMEFCFEQQKTVLSLTDMSKNDFVVYWSQQVGTKFGLDSSKILAVYDLGSDVHNTERKTRAIWKYGAAKGVFGTPLAYVNGVQLDTFPTTSTELVDLLTEVHNSQWNVSKWETGAATTIDN